jgi:periplasmic protein TonB
MTERTKQPAARPKPKIGPNDRLGMTMMIAGLMHAVLILGVTFQAEALDPELTSSLDVILVQTKSDQAPEKADFIAQANQVGGGESDKAERPSDLFSGPIPKPDPGIAPMPIDAAARAPQQEVNEEEVLTVQRGESTIDSIKSERAAPNQVDLAQAEEDRQAMEMARLQAEINKTRQAYAKRPKRKFITANTREDGYAMYMASWVAKVERVGNINYPEKAREGNLQGSLVLTVAIRRDGSVEKIEIIQSSGEQLLDDAAVRIVEIAAPFDVTPEVGGERFDVLHITRTWQFLPGNILQSQ